MKDAYTLAFFDVVKDTQQKYGYELPLDLEHYIVMLLAYHVDRPDFLPQDSFAETFLRITNSMSAKELGDTCLFVTGVFPTYGTRRGLNKKYYSDIGKSSYTRAAVSLHGDLFNNLALHFEFLSDFIEISVSSAKRSHSNLFR